MVFTTVDREFNTVWEIIYVRWHFECSHKKLYNKSLSAWGKLSHRFLLTLKLQITIFIRVAPVLYWEGPYETLSPRLLQPSIWVRVVPTYQLFSVIFFQLGSLKWSMKVKWNEKLSFFLQPPPFSFTEKWQTKAWNRRKNVYVAV